MPGLPDRGCIRLFVHRDPELRAASLAEDRGLGPAAARRQLRRLDRIRSRFYRTGNRDWGYARWYAASVNTTDADPEQLSRAVIPCLLPEQEARKMASAG